MSEVQSIGDLIATLIDYRGKTPPKSSSGIPLITAKVIKQGQIKDDDPEYISEETYSTWMRRGYPKTGDILITTEAPLGEVARIGENARIALAQRVILLRPDSGKVDPSFLFHFLRSPAAQALLNQRASGTTVSGIRQPELRAVEVPLPPRRDQEWAGSILDAIDGLIENNRRRIKLLEQIAQAIYREWFVDFHYPGHHGTSLVDSSLGPIPPGWEISSASAAVEINPRVSLDKSLAHPFLPMGDVDEHRMICVPNDEKHGTSGAKFQNGDTLFARITPCLENGKTGLVLSLPSETVGRGSTEFIVLRGRQVGPAFTYFLARSDEFRGHAIQSMSGASGRQRVRNECFDSFFVPVPPAPLAKQFEEVVAPSLEMALGLELGSRRLATLRDLLLPKLLTGQIEVSELV